MSTPRRSIWEPLLGFFVDNKLIVIVLSLLLIGGGLYTSPFDWELGGMPRQPVPVDAIPDVGENQQIVFTTWPGRSPRDVEDQVSYPLTTALLGIAGVRTVRSSSMLGFSSIYVIFEDDIEFYWARSRVLEKLASLPADLLPPDASPTLGPDATALGQVFWYTLEGHDPEGKATGGWDLHELRSIQDFTVRYALASVSGVSEVASIGGFVREYQVDVDGEALRGHGVTLGQVAAAVKASNLDTGARTMEINRVEYLIRGIGFLQGIEDLTETVVAVRDHTPIRVRDVARVTLGPAQRRGALDDAGAETVGGVVVVRYGANPLQVIEGVKKKIAEIAPGLPERTLDDGRVSKVVIKPFYDRTTLIHETLDTLSTALIQQILITVIVVLVMLRNLRTSILISMVLPLAVLMTFIAMKVTGVDANIMALAGIAIAIGTMVDMGIVFVENIAKRLEEAEAEALEAARTLSFAERAGVVRGASAEVASAVLTSVATTVVSFLPVFALTASEGKLFTPLAYTKTFALMASVLIAMTILPAVAHLLLAPAPRGQQAGVPWRVWLRSVLRADRMRNALLLAGGVALWALGFWQGGLAVIVLTLTMIALPLAGSKRRSQLEQAMQLLAVATVTILLSNDWQPLGSRAGWLPNLLFVGTLSFGLLWAFHIFQQLYPALLRTFLQHRIAFLAVPFSIMLFGITAWLGFTTVFGWLPDSVRLSSPVTRIAHALPGFGREYMPPFDEGSFLYMPTTMPHASIGQALETMKQMDAAIASIPEVERAVGKLGRADSALDPAPVSMYETLISYKSEYREDGNGQRIRQWRDHIRTPADIWDEIVKAADLPGLTSAPVLQPISTRIVMLQSGMRAPMGIKVRGPDLESIERFGMQLEGLLKEVPTVRAETVFADRVVGKPYLEVAIDREAIGRYGLTIAQVQDVVQIGLGGRTLTRTVEGRERYPVRVRFAREERDSVAALMTVQVAIPGGESVPLSQLASIRYARGPQVIKAEDTFLTSYVLFDRQPDRAEVDVVLDAQRYLKEKIASGALQVPAGVSYAFAGSYENQVRSEKRLMVLIPIALMTILLLLQLQFRRLSTTLIIYSGVAVAVAGGFGLLWLYGIGGFMDFSLFGRNMAELFQVHSVNMSVAVWIGFIALLGIATDDGVVMSTYLKQRFEEAPPKTIEDVRERTLEAGLRRVRPCLMTTATTLIALLPVITSVGRGSDVMVPMALPALGGMSIALITLFVVPVLYSWVEEQRLRRQLNEDRKQ